ncbi:MAG: sigma factor [Christensenellales bacterium]|jgi:DNA-directed RNA polymerase specialized sigma24 family protein
MNNTVAAETVREQRFIEWMKTYGDIILRTCFVYSFNVHDAEDAAQDTFLKAWKAMEQFEKRNGASEKTWLIKIAINDWQQQIDNEHTSRCSWRDSAEKKPHCNILWQCFVI